MNFMILKKEEICAGDVLLCFSKMMVDKGEEGGSGYSHVAISLNDQDVLESNSAGVHVSSVSHLLDEYEHIAVLRNPALWNRDRLDILGKFATENIEKKFNRFGMQKYSDRKIEYQEKAMERVQGYFEGTEPEVSTNRAVYFCSELVTAAFIRVGIIDQSAAVLFSPETFSPEDIGKDKAFGFFCGYVVSYPEYKIPDTDHFRSSL